jgi:diguanylate cyclase (GGDEF)-like protein
MDLELSRAKRYQKPLTVAMLDLLNFRRVNEAAGYDGGDQFLRDLTRNIQIRIRSNDIMCRYSGDRFAFIFPETDTRNSHAVVEKLQAAVSAVSFKDGELDRHINSAIATAYFPQEGAGSSEIIRLLLTRVQAEKIRAASVTA